MKWLTIFVFIALFLLLDNVYAIPEANNESDNETLETNFPVNVTATKKWAFISKAANLSFEMDNPEIAVTSIKLIINKEVENVEVKVIRFYEKPYVLISEPDDAVYQYFDINTTNLEMENVNYSEMIFQVSKDWIESENIDNTSIRITRYINETWKPMIIDVKYQDKTHYLYEITNPGFYYFAITGARIPEPGSNYICIIDDKRCYWNITQICNGTNWNMQEECDYQCKEGNCIQRHNLSRTWHRKD